MTFASGAPSPRARDGICNHRLQRWPCTATPLMSATVAHRSARWIARFVDVSVFLNPRGTEQVDYPSGASSRPVATAPLVFGVRRRPSNSPSVGVRGQSGGGFRPEPYGVCQQTDDGVIKEYEDTVARLARVVGCALETFRHESYADALSRSWDPGDVRVSRGLFLSIHAQCKFDRPAFWRQPLNEPMPVLVKQMGIQMKKYWGDGRARL